MVTDFPSRNELLEARNRVIASHPKTQFIGAHVANNAEDLSTVSEWLEKYPESVDRTCLTNRRTGTTTIYRS